MKNYCSQQFTNIFIDHPIPPNIIEIIFEHTNAGDNLEEAIESCIELINNNDWFEVITWWNKWSDIEWVKQSGRYTSWRWKNNHYHIVTIKPENDDFHDQRTILGTQ